MCPFVIKRLSYKSIGELANKFLVEFHPENTLPVPIEEIAESKLDLKIIPINRIKTDFDVEGCLDSDLKRIFIDFDIYMKVENRARFTIGHEIGHLVLHKELFESLKITSPEDIYKLSLEMSEEDYGWLEFQAYSFAGHVLVPKNLLEVEIKKRLGLLPQKAPEEKIYPIIQDLLEVFNVSGEVLIRRLAKEGFVEPNS